MVGYQLFNCRLRAAVVPHPPEGFFLHVSERRPRIFFDVPLDSSFEGRRVQSAGEDVPQHGVGEGGVGLRPQEAKAGGVLSNGLGEPLLPSKKRHSQGGGVSVFSLVLFDDLENLCGGIDVLCSHGENFLLGTPLERAQPRSQPAATGSSMGWNWKYSFASKMKSSTSPSSPENRRSL